MRAYRLLTSISLGLADGRIVHLRAGDLLPPSWAAVNQHQISQWLSSGVAVLVTNADRAALEQADRAGAIA
jgi:hypothetical protein